jgi:hypothetical protein
MRTEQGNIFSGRRMQMNESIELMNSFTGILSFSLQLLRDRTEQIQRVLSNILPRRRSLVVLIKGYASTYFLQDILATCKDLRKGVKF